MSDAPVLLSSEASARDAHALRYWNHADREKLGAAVHRIFRQWLGDFGMRGVDASHGSPLSCEAASDVVHRPEWVGCRWNGVAIPSEPNARFWWALQTGDRNQVNAQGGPEGAAGMEAALFGMSSGTRGPSEAGSLAEEVAQSALRDWIGRLCAHLGVAEGWTVEASTPPAAMLRPWSGALMLIVRVGVQTMGLLLSPECVSRYFGVWTTATVSSGSNNPLVPLLHASASLALPLRVEMEPFEIDLGTLVTLRPGDILRTSHTLEMPLVVHVGPAAKRPEASLDAQHLCGGFLGNQGDHCAVELLRRS